MTSWFPSPVSQAKEASADTPANSAHLARRLFLMLGAIAVIYAFLAGLRTVSDADLGWQMASGRWIVQHHRVFSTDVFSYTVSGASWIYPVLSGVIFYGIYLLGGYALLSWICAAACAGTVALLLRRGNAFTAATAIIAIPLIADRTGPRADMFSVILFAAYLSILWQHYQTGRARLWVLPLLMIAWVNLHPGFTAGLALILGFVGMELLEMLFSAPRRSKAVGRLRQASPWFVATTFATLVNPWGWGLYQPIIRQLFAKDRLHSQVIAEWFQARWNWVWAVPSFSQRPMQVSLDLVVVIVLVVALLAVLQRRPGEAILLVGAMYVTTRHIRMDALTACIVVVVAGSVMAATISTMRTWIPNPRIRSVVAKAAVVIVAAFACLRAADFVTNRVYLDSNTWSSFGAGPARWLPERAAAFIERENLPAQVFNNFDEGGYLVWRLGLKYRDYIDGRSIPFGDEGFMHHRQLLQASVDSPEWQQEANRYNINTILVQLDTPEIEFTQLQDLCYSKNWQPVYLDEISIVLVRRTPETEGLINRLQVSCATVSLPAEPLDHSARSFQLWAYTAYVLAALRRTNDALTAANNAFLIFPGNASLRWVRGNLLYASDRRVEAEQEWLAALALGLGDSDAVIVWSRLAELYGQQDRIPEAMHAWQQIVQLTTDAASKSRGLVQLARLYLRTGHAKEASQALDKAVRQAPPELLKATNGRSFSFDVAQGRAASSRRLGDIAQAIVYQEQAVQLDPDAADAWSFLARLYAQQGRTADEHRAEERAKALATSQTP